MQFLKIYYVILGENPDFEEDLETEASWEREDHLCRSYLLNSLTDNLVDIYFNKSSAKDIWNALKDQYKD